MKKIGFIGVGIMGKSMVRNLKKAGFDLHIYARTKAKVEDVIAEGVTFHDSIADCVKDCEAVITIVGFPQDVEEVYFDQGNILDSAKEGAYLIDMTTTSPQIAQKIYEEGNKRGFHVLETKKILKHVCLCLKQWEPILTTREQQDADSTVSWRIRS